MGLPLVTAANPITDSPSTDEGANQVLSGTFSAAGPSRPIAVYGQFNFTLNGVLSLAIRTSAGRDWIGINTPNASLAAGQSVQSTLLPAGATIVAFTTTGMGGTVSSCQIGGLTTTQIAAIASGSDAAATFVGVGITPTATVNLERSFDGGYTWIVAGIAGSGVAASYEFGSSAIDNPVSVVAGEPEREVGYRLNCVEFSGSINVAYRISITGLAAQTWGIPGN